MTPMRCAAAWGRRSDAFAKIAGAPHKTSMNKLLLAMVTAFFGGGLGSVACESAAAVGLAISAKFVGHAISRKVVA